MADGQVKLRDVRSDLVDGSRSQTLTINPRELSDGYDDVPVAKTRTGIRQRTSRATARLGVGHR